MSCPKCDDFENTCSLKTDNQSMLIQNHYIFYNFELMQTFKIYNHQAKLKIL